MIDVDQRAAGTEGTPAAAGATPTSESGGPDRRCRRCPRTIHPQHPERCPDCHYARGLCTGCYVHERRAGRLDQYPLTWRRRKKRDCPHGGRHRHGTAIAYEKDGCGCDRCARAKRELNARWGKRVYLNGGPLLIDATGVRRRIQALMRMGWTTEAIASEGGWATDDAVYHLRRRQYVTQANAARVRRVYDRLSMRPGPSEKARRHAARAGWAPPLAWDDERIDDPAAKPCGVPLTNDSRRRASSGPVKAGAPAGSISERVA